MACTGSTSTSDPLLEHEDWLLIEENGKIAESSLELMPDQHHSNVVLASQRLVLSCLLLEWNNLE